MSLVGRLTALRDARGMTRMPDGWLQLLASAQRIFQGEHNQSSLRSILATLSQQAADDIPIIPDDDMDALIALLDVVGSEGGADGGVVIKKERDPLEGLRAVQSGEIEFNIPEESEPATADAAPIGVENSQPEADLTPPKHAPSSPLLPPPPPPPEPEGQPGDEPASTDPATASSPASASSSASPASGGGTVSEPLVENGLPEAWIFSDDADNFNSVNGQLAISAHDDGLTAGLWWTESNSTEPVVYYVVVGSHTQVPSRPADGDGLAYVTITKARVTAAYRYYAVFTYAGESDRDAATSVSVRQGVGQLVPGPTDVATQLNPNSIVIRWQQTNMVAGGVIRRAGPLNVGFTAASPVAEPVEVTVDPTSGIYIDRDVLPGRVYEYQIVFRSPSVSKESATDSSRAWRSEPFTVPASPGRVTDLVGVAWDHQQMVLCRLTWTLPEAGVVTIYRKPGQPGELELLDPTHLYSQEELQRLSLGEPVAWQVTEDDGTACIDGLALNVAQGPENKPSPEWCFTPVTEFAGQYSIGELAVVTHIGNVTNCEMIDRVTWQLLRFDWPTGADYVMIDIDGENQRCIFSEYCLYGGARLKLPTNPCTIRLYGEAKYEGRSMVGEAAHAKYDGRQLIYYRLDRKMMSRCVLRASVETSRNATLSTSVMGHPTDYPLIADPRIQAGVGLVYTRDLPPGSLQPQVWSELGEFKAPKEMQLALFARSTSPEPVALLPVPPKALVQSRQANSRCPNCFSSKSDTTQLFRCFGSCPGQEDPLLSQFRGKPTIAKPAILSMMIKGKTVTHVNCGRCNTTTAEECCPSCGESFPTTAWWDNDFYSIQILGPTHSGKTTTLESLSFLLRRNIVESWGGNVRDIDDATTRQLDAFARDWGKGKLQQGTTAAAQGGAVLVPMRLGLRLADRRRQAVLSLYDTAGEDMGSPSTLEAYSRSLTNADALLYLVDPLQIDSVRLALKGYVPIPGQLSISPTQALTNLIDTLRRRFPGGQRIPVKLGVIFAKFDAIVQAAQVPSSPIAGAIPFGAALTRDPYSDPQRADGRVYDVEDGLQVHGEARTLMNLLGGSALIKLVEDNFADYQYFVSSATGHTPAGAQMFSAARSPQRLWDPLRWVMGG